MCYVTQIYDDDQPIHFKRTNSGISKNNNYMLCDDDTDDEDDKYKIPSEDEYEGVWVNVNDLPEPFYPLKEYKPRYVIPDDDIIEESPLGNLSNTILNTFIIKFGI